MQAEPTLNLTTCKFDERPSITHLVRHATTFRESIQSLNISQLILSSHAILSPTKLPGVHITLDYPFKDEAQTALFKDPVRTAQ